MIWSYKKSEILEVSEKGNNVSSNMFIMDIENKKLEKTFDSQNLWCCKGAMQWLYLFITMYYELKCLFNFWV
jgi:hypothetical protein